MIDKDCIIQIFGSLMRHPSYLSEIDKYSLNISDFSNKFYRIIFTAINGLHNNGAKIINPIDVENYLSSNQSAKLLFEQRSGIDFLQDAVEMSEEQNFDYYYKKLKKINLLRDLKESGIDTSDFYIEDLTNPKALEVNKIFEELDIRDIIEGLKKKFAKVEHNYANGEVTESSKASEGIRELVEEIEENPEVGRPLQGKIFNEVTTGALKGKLYIRSGGSGVSKTRQAVGDACYLAYPYRYDEITCKWVNNGSSEKVMFIATEQTKREIQKMILAYLTGFNESKFKYGKFSENEKIIIQQAFWVMDQFADNFIIVRMPNPTIELVKLIVRENCILHDIEYVFYDYIFIGPSLLGEFRGFNLRNDEVLLMFATALKDLAVELDVFMMTSTQLNANGDDNKDIRNESALAGGRSTINKADVGAIMARVSKEEYELIKEYTDKYGEVPNIVTDIFKIRSGVFNQVRIWSNVNLGNLRKKDLFITNARLEEVEDFSYSVPISFEELDVEQIEKELSYLNNLMDF